MYNKSMVKGEKNKELWLCRRWTYTATLIKIIMTPMQLENFIKNML